MDNKTYWPIDKLQNWEHNPREIKTKDFERLKRQITNLGQHTPLLVDENGIVYSGNMRLRAYKELGVDKVWVNIITGDDKRKMEYALSANDRAGYYSDDLLANLIPNFPEFKWEDYAVDLKEPQNLGELVDKFTPVAEDDVPEVDTDNEPISKLGEVYQLGRHRLMCGDATKREDVERLMGGQKADVGITDPPYGVRDKEEWDNKQNFLDSFGDWMVNLYEYTQLGFLWFCAGSMVPFIFKVADQKGINLDRLLIWNKPAGSQYAGASHNNLWYSMEPILIFGKEGLNKNLEENADFGYSVFESRTVPSAENGHPTSKPIDLMAWLVNHYSKKDQVILDLFAGSGSTLIACEQTNRTCYMMELSEKYVDVCRRRYWKFVSGKEDGWDEMTPVIQNS